MDESLRRNEQSESSLPELKNETASCQTTPFKTAPPLRTAQFDPISMTSYETNPSTRRSAKSRPPEKLSKFSTRSQPVYRTRKTANNEEKPDDAEVEAAFNAFISEGEVPPIETKDYVVQYINRQKVRSLLFGQYSQAKQLDKVMESLNESYKQEAIVMSREIQNGFVNDKRAEYQQQWAEENAKWDQRVQQQTADNEQYNAALENRQVEEMQAFKDKWQAPEFIETFNKPSQMLLNLRYQETKLALTKNYDEAEKLREVANKRQTEEENAMRMNMESQMRKEFSKIKERHAKEKENAAEHQRKTFELIEKQRQKALKEYEVTDKIPQLSRIMLSTIVRDVNHPCSQLQTPRTASSLVSFRTQRHAKLNLSPMEEGDFEQLEEAQNLRPKSTPKPKTLIKSKSNGRVSRRLIPVL